MKAGLVAAEPFIDALASLFAARRFGVKLTLDPLCSVLARLGRPERRLGAIVHIGGTNGKGSTAAMVAGVARAAGVRVALYTSPHLVTICERIAVDGTPISREQFAATLRLVHDAGGAVLTFFEQVTAVALVHFAAVAPELTILEVGLGGRGDATRAIGGSAAVAAVVGVGFDHTELLGHTLEAIAFEKAGIFVQGGHAVIGRSGHADAVPHLLGFARNQGAKVVEVVGAAELAMVPAVLALPGAHQRDNAATAAAILRALAAGPLPALQRQWIGGVWPALGEAAWVVHPGRYERCTWRNARVILDGAHNAEGAAALAAALQADAAVVGASPKLAVLGVSAGKDVAAMAEAIVPWADVVVASSFDNDRALSAEMLAAALGPIAAIRKVELIISPVLEHALDDAAVRAGVGGVVVVAGSLMAVGAARAYILGLVPDPVAAVDPSTITVGRSP